MKEDSKAIEDDTRRIARETQNPTRRLLSQIDELLCDYLVEHRDKSDAAILDLHEEVSRLSQPYVRPDTIPSPPPPRPDPDDVVTAQTPITLRPEPQAPASSQGRGRILVIDDDPIVVEQLTRLLAAEGYRCFRALNGVQALARLLGGTVESQIPRPDLILLDVTMPILNGPAVIRALDMTAYAEIPIVLISDGPIPMAEDHRFVFLRSLDQILETVRYWLAGSPL